VLGRIYDGSAGAGAGAATSARLGAAPYPERALRAAIAEAAAWGAELLVVKGDLTRVATVAEVRDAGRLLATSPVPVAAILGNHDNRLGVDTRGLLASQGIDIAWAPQAVDVPGLRIVLVDTTHGDARHHRGRLSAPVAARVAALAGEVATGAMVVLHHPPEMHRYPTVYPPGIPFAEGRRLLDALAESHPATLVTCGHRHRNRRYGYGPITITEVSATKDYPGVWAGYRVFEGGIVQTVRRISSPDVIGWTETTRRAVNGQWGRWSPGRLADRCFSIDWPG
ncbi:MAG: metallophosphoesterase family protein, partial [Acidimicrobiales bacterium]